MKNNDTILEDTTITEHLPQVKEITDRGSSLPSQQGGVDSGPIYK